MHKGRMIHWCGFLEERRKPMPVRQMTLTALMTALMCLIGPLTLPLGAVPLSLTSAALMLAAMLLGPRRACMACLVYLLLGLAGLPVLSGFTGGAARLLGPTGGFLMGYLPMTALCALGCRRDASRFRQLTGMLTGTLTLYAMGTAWYCLQAQVDPVSALMVCVLPFLTGDAAKMIAVLLLGPEIRKRLRSSGLLR